MIQGCQNLGKINSNLVPAGFDLTAIQYQRSEWGSVHVPANAGSNCKGDELYCAIRLGLKRQRGLRTKTKGLDFRKVNFSLLGAQLGAIPWEDYMVNKGSSKCWEVSRMLSWKHRNSSSTLKLREVGRARDSLG